MLPETRPQIYIGEYGIAAHLDNLELEGYFKHSPTLAGFFNSSPEHSWLITDASKNDYQKLPIPVDTLLHSSTPITFCEVGPGVSEFSLLLAQRQPITVIEPFPYQTCADIITNLLKEKAIPESLKRLIEIWEDRISQYIQHPNITRYALTLDQALQTHRELYNAFDVVVASGVQFSDPNSQNALKNLISRNGHIYPG